MSEYVNVPEVGAPRKLAYQFLDLTRSDTAVFVLGIALAWTAARSIGFWGIVLAVGFFAYLLRPRMNGRQYYVGAMELYGSVWIDKVLERTMWSADEKRSDLRT